MKRILITIVLLVLIFALARAFAAPVTVLRVVDGDSIEIDAGLWLKGEGLEQVMSRAVLVRVLGVDTPEIRGKSECERKLAVEARGFVRGWLAAGKIEVEVVGLDKYGGRVDAHVRRGERVLADDIIAAGLGRAYAGGTRGAWC